MYFEIISSTHQTTNEPLSFLAPNRPHHHDAPYPSATDDTGIVAMCCPSAWQTATAGSSIGSPAGMGWNIKHHRREEDEGTATTTTTTSNAPRATGTDWKQSQAVPAPSTSGGSRGGTLPELPGNRDFPLPSSSSTGGSQEGQQPQPPPPPPSSPSSPQDNNNNGTAMTIGLSVGVSVAVVALILAAVLLVVHRRRRRRRRRRSSSSSSFSAGGERGEYSAGPPPPPPAEMLQPQQYPQRWTELPAPLPRATTRTRPC
ncbi:hypothetical protein PG985_015747 [Apiospora marii]|uniref:uncharacterized protein n=1 Tax=Apiospora marii TaxID=335849 RepID=UPI003130C376